MVGCTFAPDLNTFAGENSRVTIAQATRYLTLNQLCDV